MEALKLGDVVQLKSGGPIMTISGGGSISLGRENTYFECTWFDESNHLRYAEFPKESLKKVERL